ncbi:MAG: flagellar motor switch protein FliN, partial [Candidatus Neomarinimicrobiota bacterium]
VVRDANKKARKADYPAVGIFFQSFGKVNCQHLLELPKDAVLQLYAWMIGAEPEKQLHNATLEGMQEGTNQILGQLQAATDGQPSAFKASGMKVRLLEDGKNLELPVSGTGIDATHTVAVGDRTFEVRHFVWALDQDDAADFDDGAIDVHPAEFSSFPMDAGGNNESHSIDMLLDVELEILVQLGRKTMTIRDILKLGKGSVIELEKAAGEHLDIFVNRRKLAEGEVVVIDDHFGIRISQLLSPQERIKSLG